MIFVDCQFYLLWVGITGFILTALEEVVLLLAPCIKIWIKEKQKTELNFKYKTIINPRLGDLEDAFSNFRGGGLTVETWSKSWNIWLLFSFFGHTHSMWKFLGQGLSNLCHPAATQAEWEGWILNLMSHQGIVEGQNIWLLLWVQFINMLTPWGGYLTCWSL